MIFDEIAIRCSDEEGVEIMESDEQYLPTTVVLLIVAGAILVLFSIIAAQMFEGASLFSDKGILISRAILFPLGILMMFWGIFISLSNSDKVAKSIVGAFAIVFIFLFEIYLFHSPPQQIDISQMQNGILKYSIISKGDNSVGDTTRTVFRTMLDVNSLPTRRQLENTAKAIWRNGDTTAAETSILLYLPGMDTKSTEYADVEFYPGGMKSISIHNYVLKLNNITFLINGFFD